MAGFREFVTGEVLTAANVDDFLAKQAVMKFADAAARDTALGTAVASGNALREGMVAYLDDTDEVIKYDGTDWSSVGEASGLVAVKHALFTGTQANSTASGATFAITDLTITHEVSDSANRLILMAQVGTIAESQQLGGVGMRLMQDATPIGVGAAVGTRQQISAGGGLTTNSGGTSITRSLSAVAVITPGAGSKTYTVEAFNSRGGTATVYVNRTESDGNFVYEPRSASTLTLMEVKV
jgi:hypothetical protein